MNDIFRKRNISYSTRNCCGLETQNIKTIHYGSETIAYLGPKICDLVPQKIKDSENIDTYKSNIRLRNQRIIHASCANYTYRNLGFFDMPFLYCAFICFNCYFQYICICFTYMNYFFQCTYLLKFKLSLCFLILYPCGYELKLAARP